MAQLVEALHDKLEGREFFFRWVHYDFFIDRIFFRPHDGPGDDSASNRKEYQGPFLGSKCGRCVELTTLTPLCADSLEILRARRFNYWSPTSASRPVVG